MLTGSTTPAASASWSRPCARGCDCEIVRRGPAGRFLIGEDCAPKRVISKVLETGTDSRDVVVWNTKNSFLQLNMPILMTYLKENHQNGRVSTSEILAAST
jgi:hypothetical protein